MKRFSPFLPFRYSKTYIYIDSPPHCPAVFKAYVWKLPYRLDLEPWPGGPETDRASRLLLVQGQRLRRKNRARTLRLAVLRADQLDFLTFA
jgi:hypothetical protein